MSAEGHPIRGGTLECVHGDATSAGVTDVTDTASRTGVTDSPTTVRLRCRPAVPVSVAASDRAVGIPVITISTSWLSVATSDHCAPVIMISCLSAAVH